MDCCESSKPKETDKDIKSDQTGNEKKPVEKEQSYGGTKDMLLHMEEI
ncbi:MAG: hypothetical protein MPEBLZ_03433 [Candidatus Methanoperedens nitroreducens]|uniref:Uncharacterized protein n=1 Tax=Candidatus Methanoperedens nitratireducens TaxID=1392998 RepID=A0A0P8A614_9EURY|nr:MAG: hypothetical protein MPEBLZ_03433 [Candidatus Methanoperedens sp. BLZ1]MBZ0176368.1 hypothetical protein [Candidatus Methanoperedens nitroreducens]MCX9078090.1 hypothetical protein [Candidatus Methanoperedens sp.]